MTEVLVDADAPEPVVEHDHASIGQRVGAAALEVLLFGACLGVGWLLWWIVLWDNGQTPAKAALKLRVVRASDGYIPPTGRMAAHELLAKGLLPLALVSGAVALVDRDHRSLWDRVTGTVVIRDPRAGERTDLP